MTVTDVTGLIRFGAATGLPATPDDPVPERVPSGHSGTLNMVRTTTGQRVAPSRGRG